MPQVEGMSGPSLSRAMELRRYLGAHLMGLLLPREINTRENAISKAEELVNAGYSIICVYPHYSEADGLQLLSSVASVSPTLRHMNFLTPVAYHMRDQADKITKPFGIKTIPIVVQDTVDRGENFDENGVELPLGFGMSKYATEAYKTLQNRGFVFLAPQQGRRRRLTATKFKPVETLLRSIDRNDRNSGNNTKVAILFAGLGFTNVGNYRRKDFSGLNIGKKTSVTLGPVLTREELDSALAEFNINRENKISLDEFVLWQIGQLVPTVYNNLDSGSTDATGHL